MQRAFKTKLKINNKESSTLRHACDVSRFVYNWALADRKSAYEERGESVGYNAQKVRFNALKREAFPWLLNAPYVAVEYAFRDLDVAYKNFFRRVRDGTEEPGFPKFKSRYDDRQSFSVHPVMVEEGRVKLPIIGWVRLDERGYIPAGKHTGRATISTKAGDWWISVQMDVPADPQPARTSETIGVDIGHGILATTSDGTQYENPRVLEGYERRMARLQRELSRRQKGSANRKKTKQKIAKLHEKIARIRAHGLHDTSRKIIDKRAGVIAIEGYHIRKMMEQTPSALRKYARRNFKMADAAVGELRRQVTYKQEWAGGEVFITNHNAPTNRQHCDCGHINAVVPLVEEFICAGCGATVNRRLNSAQNVVQLAVSLSQG